MKKVLAVLGLMFGIASLSFAGTPIENYYMGQPPLSNTTVIGSTYTTVNTVSPQVVLPAVTSTIGSGSTSCRYCFTKFVVQLASTTVFQVLDGGTTVQTIDGADLGATGPNTLALVEDHLGPMCLTAGNTATLKAVNTTTGSANHTAINYEGYTYCGGTANAGPMQ